MRNFYIIHHESRCKIKRQRITTAVQLDDSIGDVEETDKMSKADKMSNISRNEKILV